MALDPLAIWVQKLEALPGASDYVTGCTNFANCIGGLTDKVQAGAQGRVGILTFNNAVMAQYLISQIAPVAASGSFGPWQSTQWAQIVWQAWFDGMNQGVVSPNTVTNGAWSCSEDLDSNTPSSVPAVITNLATLSSGLNASLQNIAQSFQPPIQSTIPNISTAMAQAFRSAISGATFVCVGSEVTPSGCVNLPLTFSAL